MGKQSLGIKYGNTPYDPGYQENSEGRRQKRFALSAAFCIPEHKSVYSFTLLLNLLPSLVWSICG